MLLVRTCDLETSQRNFAQWQARSTAFMLCFRSKILEKLREVKYYASPASRLTADLPFGPRSKPFSKPGGRVLLSMKLTQKPRIGIVSRAYCSDAESIIISVRRGLLLPSTAAVEKPVSGIMLLVPCLRQPHGPYDPPSLDKAVLKPMTGIELAFAPTT